MGCRECPPGFGRGPACTCVICTPGETFSLVWSKLPCENCQTCGENEKVENICTRTNNTKCKCQDTFERHPVTDQCTECCHCKTGYWKERTEACMHRTDARLCMTNSLDGKCDEGQTVTSVHPSPSIHNRNRHSAKSITPANSTVSHSSKRKSSPNTIQPTSSTRYPNFSPFPSGLPFTKSINPSMSSEINNRASEFKHTNTSDAYSTLLLLLLFILFIPVLVIYLKRKNRRTYHGIQADHDLYDAENDGAQYGNVSTEEPLTLSCLDQDTINKLSTCLEPNRAWEMFGFKCSEKFCNPQRKEQFNYKIEMCGQVENAEQLLNSWKVDYPERTVKTLRDYAYEFRREDILYFLTDKNIPDDQLITKLKVDEMTQLKCLINRNLPALVEGGCEWFFRKDYGMDRWNIVSTISAVKWEPASRKLFRLLLQNFGEKVPLSELASVAEEMDRIDVKNIIDAFLKQKSPGNS